MTTNDDNYSERDQTIKRLQLELDESEWNRASERLFTLNRSFDVMIVNLGEVQKILQESETNKFFASRLRDAKVAGEVQTNLDYAILAMCLSITSFKEISNRVITEHYGSTDFYQKFKREHDRIHGKDHVLFLLNLRNYLGHVAVTPWRFQRSSTFTSHEICQITIDPDSLLKEKSIWSSAVKTFLHNQPKTGVPITYIVSDYLHEIYRLWQSTTNDISYYHREQRQKDSETTKELYLTLSDGAFDSHKGLIEAARQMLRREQEQKSNSDDVT